MKPTIIIIGRCGYGKSALANALLAQPLFRVADGGRIVTLYFNQSEAKITSQLSKRNCGANYYIVDTPPLGSNPPDIKTYISHKELGAFLNKVNDKSSTVFVYLLSSYHISCQKYIIEEHIIEINELRRKFGNKIYFVMTHADKCDINSEVNVFKKILNIDHIYPVICSEEANNQIYKDNRNQPEYLLINKLLFSIFSQIPGCEAHTNIILEKLITVKNIDCSHSKLNKDSMENLISMLLAYNPNFISLNLSYCDIDDKFMESQLAPLLQQKFPYFTELNLRGNLITYTGARLLAATRNKSLKELDLSDNRISCVKQLLEKLKSGFSDWPALASINLSQNFIDKDCRPVFQKQLVSFNEISYRYGFYYTQPKSINSLLDKKFEITREGWVVSLVCKKDIQHAMIYMEGMKKWGQRFLERYHISAQGVIGFAQLHVEEPDLKFFDPKQFYMVSHPINRIKGNILRDLVETEKNEKIKFSKFYPSSSKNSVNCVEWCLYKLKAVDIYIDKSLLGLPSSTAGGHCLVQ